MRNINSVALAEISREFGLEPILIVRVFWNSIPVDYSDKANPVENVVGKVLDISGIDDVLSIDTGGTSNTVTVKLDDADGEIRNVINNKDIHKRPVQILQWFAGQPKSEAFVIFTGQINTPMEWSEGERSFQFTAVNMVENLEFGFSLEEGIFTNLPAPVYGRAMPIVFGNVLRVPSVMLSESPSGILAEGFAWIMRGKDLVEGGSGQTIYEKHLGELSKSSGDAFAKSQLLFQEGAGAELIGSFYNDGRDTPFPDDQSTYESYHSQAQQLFAQSAEMMGESRKFTEQARVLRDDFDQKKAYAKNPVQIASINFPRGYPVIVEIEGSRFSARFDGIGMTILDYILPSNLRPGERYLAQMHETTTVRTYQAAEADTKFKWFDAGSKIRVISVPLYYCACFGQGPTVNAVYARMQGVRVRVPNSYFEVQKIPFTNSLGTTAWLTVVKMNQPISTILDASGQALYESDDIWCDITSDVPGYYGNIISWAVTMFSNLTVDPDFFLAVSSLTFNSPMNFAYLERVNVWDFIKEVSYQARVSVWVDDRRVKFHYLPAEYPQADVITPDDIVEDTLVITCNDTESLVTKLTATWRPTLDQQEPNKIILRQNVAIYGLHEETYNFFAYNTDEMVKRAASFWLIRKSNTWKKIRFKTWLHKLALESHDTVLLSGFNGAFSRNDVKGIIESAIYDSASNTIDMTVWLPIRWGEMDPYVFAYPANVYEFYGIPSLEFYTGSPFFDVQDTTGFMSKVGLGFISVGPFKPLTSRVPEQIADTPPSYTVSTAITQGAIDALRVDGLQSANNFNRNVLLDLPAVSAPETTSTTVEIGTVVGTVGDSNTLYIVQPVVGGSEIKVTQMRIADGFKVPNGTGVYAVKKRGSWYMQSPVWAKEAVV